MFAFPSPIPTTYFLNIDLSSYAPRYVRYHYLYKSALVIWSSVLTCACLNHFKHHWQKQNLKLPNSALCPVLKGFLGSKTVQMYQHLSYCLWKWTHGCVTTRIYKSEWYESKFLLDYICEQAFLLHVERKFGLSHLDTYSCHEPSEEDDINARAVLFREGQIRNTSALCVNKESGKERGRETSEGSRGMLIGALSHVERDGNGTSFILNEHIVNFTDVQ